MKVDVQKDALADARQEAVNGRRDIDFVADPADIQNDCRGVGMGEQSAQGSNHNCPPADGWVRAWRRLSRSRRSVCASTARLSAGS